MLPVGRAGRRAVTAGRDERRGRVPYCWRTARTGWPSTWVFGAADSGSAGNPVIWQAAPGAHPVISGASQVTGWTQVGSSGVWSAPVPAGSASRQLYVNGQEAPVASASPSALGFTGSWTGSSTGYSISHDSAATAWFGSLTARSGRGRGIRLPGRQRSVDRVQVPRGELLGRREDADDGSAVLGRYHPAVIVQSGQRRLAVDVGEHQAGSGRRTRGPCCTRGSGSWTRPRARCTTSRRPASR